MAEHFLIIVLGRFRAQGSIEDFLYGVDTKIGSADKDQELFSQVCLHFAKSHHDESPQDENEGNDQFPLAF